MHRKLAMSLALSAALAAPALADTITLKNGHELHGQLIEEGKDYVSFKVVGGVLRLDKKDIATFTEDEDFGQRYASVAKRETDADNMTPGVGGKAGRAFFVPPNVSADEKKDLRGVHIRIEEELAKLGPSDAERQHHLDCNATERATLDAAIANLGKSRASASEFSSLGPKCIEALSESLQGGDTATKGDAANALSDAVTRGDESDTKWALGKYKLGLLLAGVLDSAGDDASAAARNAANRALETISGKSFNWAESKDPVPSDAQRTAIASWKDWATADAAAWDKADKAAEDARAKLRKDWLDLEDPTNWRKALARCIDAYGTTPTTGDKGKEGGDKTPAASDADKPTNSDIAKEATPEEQTKLADLKRKIKDSLEKTVGLSVADRKKKYEPTADETAQMQTTLDQLSEGGGPRRGRNDKENNRVSELVAFGLKALDPVAGLIGGDNGGSSDAAAKALGQIYSGADPEDAYVLFRAGGIAGKVQGLLSASGDVRSAQYRTDADSALQTIVGQSVGYPAGTDQTPSPEEIDAAQKWSALIAKDAADFTARETLREQHRKVLNELLKKLDSPKGWKDALADATKELKKAEEDLSKK
jgi:hypothetical protein